MSSGRADITDDKLLRTVKLQYLGDGAYAAFDEFGVWLATKDGAIYLEPAVFRALEIFMADMWKAKQRAMPNQPLGLDAIRDYPGPVLLARCLDMIEEAVENILPKGYAAMYRKMIHDQVVAQAEVALAGRRQEGDALQKGGKT